MYNTKIYKLLAAVLVLLSAIVPAAAQEVVSPCPEVLIDQKYDHTPNRRYQAQGWDTAVTCNDHMLELTSEPFIPVRFFNGYYKVEEVPYNPPDPTFAGGTRMPVGTDDDFASTTTQLSFPFYFFGIRKTGFRLGANGLITFATDQFGGGNACPWKYSASLPWTNGKSGVPTMPEGANGSVPLARMRDAIYGIYEDTHPIAGYLSGQQGIYYGIQGEWPCRKIICSWNGIPTYPGGSNLDNRCTYQIVCYEASNIIEVHVKRRGVNTDWQNGVGLIGIQNATGQPQVPSDSVGASNYFVQDSAPAFFAPEGKNTFNTQLDTVAFRFTPLGETFPSYKWYRIVEGGDSIVLGTTPGNPDGYYVPMDLDPDHPTLTRAFVEPKEPTRYVLQVMFQNAEGTWYNLSDTIFIGVDTTNTLMLVGESDGRTSGDKRQLDVCRGEQPDVRATYSEIQSATQIAWTVDAIVGGQHQTMGEDEYTVLNDGHTIRFNPVSKRNLEDPDRVDSVWLHSVVDFVSGCTNYDTFLLRLLPNYETVEEHGICHGQTFTWAANGQSYTQTTQSPYTNPGTQAGCDSIVRLDLTVFDVSHTIAPVVSCRPVTWLNGKTYSESNTATRDSDTIVLQNRYGCDSVVQLDFSLYPLTARIASSEDHFDFDHPSIELTDVSTGGDSRMWLLPGEPVNTAEVVIYTVPAGYDSADIRLVAHSPYGCTDTARLVLPFNRETMWIPNAFTPNCEGANRLFAPIGIGIMSMEMFIYDRMGRLMHHCVGTDCAWDGTDTDGNPCRQGAYAYIIRYTDGYTPDEMKVRKGAVSLIR